MKEEYTILNKEENPPRASDYHCHVLGVISKHQPIMRTDLYHLSRLAIKRDSLAYILQVLRKKGYIKCTGKDGPVWLTVRGSQAIESEVK